MLKGYVEIVISLIDLIKRGIKNMLIIGKLSTQNILEIIILKIKTKRKIFIMNDTVGFLLSALFMFGVGFVLKRLIEG